jgi:hypothetical protein
MLLNLFLVITKKLLSVCAPQLLRSTLHYDRTSDYAQTFLEFSHRQHYWNCPVCLKKASFKVLFHVLLQGVIPCTVLRNELTNTETLFIDEYISGILAGTKDDVDQVMVNPDGTWALPAPKRGTLPVVLTAPSYPLLGPRLASRQKRRGQRSKK